MASLLNMSGRALVKMPYDAEIEYLQSTGTQWIDTGVPDSWDGLVVKLDMLMNVVSGEYDFFGFTRGGSTNFNYAGFFSNLGNSFVLQIGINYVRYGTNDSLRHIHVFNGVNKTCNFDSIITNASKLSWYSNYVGTFRLFQRTNAEGIVISPSNNRLYASEFERHGVVIRKYIPVRIGTTGYLYDKISGQLFGNSGTGNFILGNDI